MNETAPTNPTAPNCPHCGAVPIFINKAKGFNITHTKECAIRTEAVTAAPAKGKSPIHDINTIALADLPAWESYCKAKAPALTTGIPVPNAPELKRCPFHQTLEGTETVTNIQCQLMEGHTGDHQFQTFQS